MALFNDFESKEDIFDLIKKFDESNLFELELSIPVPQQCIKIKMMKLSQDNPEGPATRVTIEDVDGDENLNVVRGDLDALKYSKNNKIIKSPLVGTFYLSPSPETEPYINAGDKITKGMVLCIIEAMKTMNEIESETDGEIAEILAKNGSPVEFGQPLFRLK